MGGGGGGPFLPKRRDLGFGGLGYHLILGPLFWQELGRKRVTPIVVLLPSLIVLNLIIVNIKILFIAKHDKL
jgi:hypothetical protein